MRIWDTLRSFCIVHFDTFWPSIFIYQDRLLPYFRIVHFHYLRVVQTKHILFLKSMSEKVGSDIKRLWNRVMNFWIDSKSIEDNVIRIQSRFMSDPTFSDIDFRNKMALVWTTLQSLRPSTSALLDRPLSLFRIFGSSTLSRMTGQFGSRTSTFARPSTLSTADFHLGLGVISKINQFVFGRLLS